MLRFNKIYKIVRIILMILTILTMLGVSVRVFADDIDNTPIPTNETIENQEPTETQNPIIQNVTYEIENNNLVLYAILFMLVLIYLNGVYKDII